MKIKYKYLFLVASSFICMHLFAQENLDSLLKIAGQNNPELKAKYNIYLADLQKIPQVGSLPDPDLSFGYFIQPMELISGNQQAQIQFMQMFPWFGTLKAAKDEASAMALSSLELVRAEKEELFYTVKTKYYQLFLIQKKIQLNDTTLFLLKSIEKLLLTKLSTNNASGTNSAYPTSPTQKKDNQSSNSMSMNSIEKSSSPKEMIPMNNQNMTGNSSTFTDLLLLQVEIKELEDNIESLKNQKQILTFQINLLLNRKSDIEILIPDSIIIPFFDYKDPTLFDSIMVNNPMIKMNKADMLAFQHSQEMNKKMQYPMIGLGLNYMVIDKSAMSTSEMNGKDMMMPMLSLNLPIYQKKYKAAIEEAKLLEKSTADHISNVENMLFIEFSQYQNELKNAQRELILYKDIGSLTQINFNLLLVRYSTSGGDFDALLRTHRQLLDYKQNISETLVDELTAIAGLQKLLSKN